VSKAKFQIPRTAPRRLINKQEAARHLIHAAVRMISIGEDPFAIHMLVQSADKIVTDVAKQTGAKLAFKLDEFIMQEHKSALIAVLRETYNYLKHADYDHDKDLHVVDTVRLNVLMLLMAIFNYQAIFSGEFTDHMKLHIAFSNALMPDIIKADTPLGKEMLDRVEKAADMTPREVFQLARDFSQIMVPAMAHEIAIDLQDIGDFYDVPFGCQQKQVGQD
jgi:hypothetical protein